MGTAATSVIEIIFLRPVAIGRIDRKQMTTTIEPQSAKLLSKHAANTSSSPRRTTSNWFALWLTTLLLSFLLYGRVSKTSAQGPRQTGVPSATEMLLASNDVYLSKRPYTILVPKGSQHKGKFLLHADDVPPLILSLKPSHDEAGKEIETEKEILLSVDSDFSFSCKYAAAEGLRG